MIPVQSDLEPHMSLTVPLHLYPSQVWHSAWCTLGLQVMYKAGPNRCLVCTCWLIWVAGDSLLSYTINQEFVSAMPEVTEYLSPFSPFQCLIVGGGPCGLRTAIELAYLGAKVVVVEKRDTFSRNNVLHLWPFTIHDLRGLGAKKFYGKFCAGSIDHISEWSQ